MHSGERDNTWRRSQVRRVRPRPIWRRQRRVARRGAVHLAHAGGVGCWAAVCPPDSSPSMRSSRPPPRLVPSTGMPHLLAPPTHRVLEMGASLCHGCSSSHRVPRGGAGMPLGLARSKGDQPAPPRTRARMEGHHGSEMHRKGRGFATAPAGVLKAATVGGGGDGGDGHTTQGGAPTPAGPSRPVVPPNSGDNGVMGHGESGGRGQGAGVVDRRDGGAHAPHPDSRRIHAHGLDRDRGAPSPPRDGRQWERAGRRGEGGADPDLMADERRRDQAAVVGGGRKEGAPAGRGELGDGRPRHRSRSGGGGSRSPSRGEDRFRGRDHGRRPPPYPHGRAYDDGGSRSPSPRRHRVDGREEPSDFVRALRQREGEAMRNLLGDPHRSRRRLFVGNLPHASRYLSHGLPPRRDEGHDDRFPRLSDAEDDLKAVIEAALLSAMGLRGHPVRASPATGGGGAGISSMEERLTAYETEHPVLAVTIDQHRAYAFVDFRLPLHADTLLHHFGESKRRSEDGDGPIVWFGRALVLGRPHDYTPPPGGAVTGLASHPATHGTPAAVDDHAPSSSFAKSFQPQEGSAITLSNTRRNAATIATHTKGMGVVTSDVLSKLKERLGGGRGGGGFYPPPPPSQSVPGDVDVGEGDTAPPRSSSADDEGTDAGGTAASTTATSAPAPAPTPLPPLDPTSVPLLGNVSGFNVLPAPNKAGTSVNVSNTPAGAAGMLGPGGIMALLANLKPTRIMVVHNALSDADVLSPTELTDIIADFALEAERILGTAGQLLAVRIPRPQHAGEGVDVVFARPVRLRTSTTAMLAGALPVLEDMRPPDRSKVMSSSALGFFEKVFGKGGSNLAKPGAIGSVDVAGLLTDGSVPGGASTFGAAGANFASFFDTQASNAAIMDVASGATTAITPAPPPAAAATVVEGDDGRDYDPLVGRTRGLGKVFLEFSTVDAAKLVQTELSGRAFNGRVLVTSFAPEEGYIAGDLCDFAACHQLSATAPAS